MSIGQLYGHGLVTTRISSRYGEAVWLTLSSQLSTRSMTFFKTSSAMFRPKSNLVKQYHLSRNSTVWYDHIYEWTWIWRYALDNSMRATLWPHQRHSRILSVHTSASAVYRFRWKFCSRKSSTGWTFFLSCYTTAIRGIVPLTVNTCSYYTEQAISL